MQEQSTQSRAISADKKTKQATQTEAASKTQQLEWCQITISDI